MGPSHALYSVAQVREFDAYAINVLGVPGYTLMQRAGEASLNALRSRWPTALHIAIVCGGGNNGGDGYVLARYARAAGLTVSLFAVVDPKQLKGDARRAADDFIAGGGYAQTFSADALQVAEVLVDALLGTGARAPLAPEMLAVIGAMNRSGLPILALDLPSGLDGDRGIAQGDAVRADTTITFVAPKCGLYLGSGPEYAGRVLCDSLEVTPPDGKAGEAILERIDEGEIARALPRRSRVAHKGDFGRVLVIAGGRGMAGAARLAGEAALRCGAGLVTVATAPENVSAIVGGRPELICFGASNSSDIETALEAATVVAAGPGLGTDAWSRGLLEAGLSSGKNLVVDADGLNLIASAALKVPADAILTPHPGEAARLLGCSTSDIQADRPAVLRRLVEKTGAVVVLKGAGTLVGAPGRTPALCTRGNPGMAAPGMGDVLTGAIAALLAQCRYPLLAARAGVIAHALAGDDLARQGGGRGMLALELAEGLAPLGQPLIERTLADATATEQLGAALARSAPWSAPQALVVHLHGELGAGKTTLVRGLLRELGVTGAVRSPSYTLLETYACGAHTVLHADLYRQAGSGDVASLGLRDEMRPGVMLLVEWPERATDSLPAADVRLRLSIEGTGRRAKLDGATSVGRAWLAANESS